MAAKEGGPSGINEIVRRPNTQEATPVWAKVGSDAENHVIEGEFSSTGKYKGGLHDINEARKLQGLGKIVLNEENTAANGVVQGRIGPGKGKFNTFFPKTWSKAKIIEAGKAAADQAKGQLRIIPTKNRPGIGRFVGNYDGVEIEGFVEIATGEVESFFPSWPQY